jgi:predicted ATP-dependent endonuclease of OLD family
LHIGQKSKGFQWFSSFNLKLRSHQATAGNLNKFILLIDEPGQGLHEEAQKDVKKVIEEIAGKGVQIIFSTHQPQLLGGSEIDFSRLKLITKDKYSGTQIRNVAQISGQDGYKDALSPIRTALGQITLDINTFLNDKKTVIVEGISDYYYFRAFSILLNKDNFNFIPPVGVTQIPNIYSILLGWGIPSLILVDGDRAGITEFNRIKRKLFENSEELASERIFVNRGFDGIEDIFDSDDFKLFASGILSDVVLQEHEKNSVKAGDNKDILGRTFLDKIERDRSINLEAFSDHFKTIIEAIFTFLENHS